jgi:plastocyanin domain-containing protein
MPPFQTKREVQEIVEHMKHKGDTNEVIHVNAIRNLAQVVEHPALQTKNAVGVVGYVEYDNEEWYAEQKV